MPHCQTAAKAAILLEDQATRGQASILQAVSIQKAASAIRVAD